MHNQRGGAVMKPIGVFYATREGQTKRIAYYLGQAFRARGFKTRVWNLANETGIDIDDYDAVVLAASVHAGKHERETVRFVKTHFIKLQAVPNAFLSVTLSQAGA